MIKKINLYLTLIILLFCKINLQATIQNNIIAKVDNEIISTIDLENELKIFLLLNGKKFHLLLLERKKIINHMFL